MIHSHTFYSDVNFLVMSLQFIQMNVKFN